MRKVLRYADFEARCTVYGGRDFGECNKRGSQPLADNDRPTLTYCDNAKMLALGRSKEHSDNALRRHCTRSINGNLRRSGNRERHPPARKGRHDA